MEAASLAVSFVLLRVELRFSALNLTLPAKSRDGEYLVHRQGPKYGT